MSTMGSAIPTRAIWPGVPILWAIILLGSRAGWCWGRPCCGWRGRYPRISSGWRCPKRPNEPLRVRVCPSSTSTSPQSYRDDPKNGKMRRASGGLSFLPYLDHDESILPECRALHGISGAGPGIALSKVVFIRHDQRLQFNSILYSNVPRVEPTKGEKRKEEAKRERKVRGDKRHRDPFKDTGITMTYANMCMSLSFHDVSSTACVSSSALLAIRPRRAASII